MELGTDTHRVHNEEYLPSNAALPLMCGVFSFFLFFLLSLIDKLILYFSLIGLCIISHLPIY